MTTWLLLWFVVSIIVGVALVAVSIGLVKRLVVLGRALQRFQDEVRPVAEEIARGSSRATERGSTMGERFHRRS